jgi:phospho-2-dehydro-3-deoxyheptonate aldolase
MRARTSESQTHRQMASGLSMPLGFKNTTTGDTVAALNQAGVVGDFTYISTAGGAFLEWMEGKTLPGVAALLD